MPESLTKHSKRQSWIRGELRGWMKKHHATLYNRIHHAAAIYCPTSNRDRWNLVNITLRHVMQMHFTDQWLAITRRADVLFAARSRPGSRLAQIAWDITMALQDKRVRSTIDVQKSK